MADQMVPHKGAIAINSEGYIGVITVDEPVDIQFPDIEGRVSSWVGYHLGSGQIRGRDVSPGAKWSSRNPTIVANSVEDLIYDESQSPTMKFIRRQRRAEA